MSTEQKAVGKPLAVVRISGEIRLKQEFKDTLRMLHLPKKHMCVILQPTPSTLGMIAKVKDFITWGEVHDDIVALLKEKRQETMLDKEGKKVPRPCYRLHPPRGGYERKGTKVAYTAGGVLGYRGEKINDLIQKMI